jgi:hypothetical protein
MIIFDQLCCDNCSKVVGTASKDMTKQMLAFCDPVCEYRHFMFITGQAHLEKMEKVTK